MTSPEAKAKKLLSEFTVMREGLFSNGNLERKIVHLLTQHGKERYEEGVGDNKKLFDRLLAYAGNPNASEGCRLIIQAIKEARKKL